MGGLALMMPVNGQPFYVAAAMLMGLSGTTAIAGGWMLHIITGLIVGAIFGVVITKVRIFHIGDIKRGLALGLGAGLLVWVVLFLPLMMTSGMASMLGSALMTMVFGSFAAHLVYGLVLGAIVGVVLPKTVSVNAHTCQTCEAGFKSENELMEHARKHRAPNS